MKFCKLAFIFFITSSLTFFAYGRPCLAKCHRESQQTQNHEHDCSQKKDLEKTNATDKETNCDQCTLHCNHTIVQLNDPLTFRLETLNNKTSVPYSFFHNPTYLDTPYRPPLI